MRVFFRADGGQFFFNFQASIICCDASGFSLMSLAGFCFGEIGFQGELSGGELIFRKRFRGLDWKSRQMIFGEEEAFDRCGFRCWIWFLLGYKQIVGGLPDGIFKASMLLFNDLSHGILLFLSIWIRIFFISQLLLNFFHC